jgi:hypothetical protein
VNTRHFIIFAIILIFICTLGSAYAFKEEPKPMEIHTPQRKIERQLSIPDQTSFNQSNADERSLK